MQKKLIYTTYFAFALTLLFFQKIKADEKFETSLSVAGKQRSIHNNY